MIEPPRQRSAIRHIACPLDPRTPWFATGEWKRAVELWSLQDRRLVSAFETVLDPGGRRLAAHGRDRPIVVAGAYDRHGICGYDGLTGEQLWQRKELKRIQVLQPLPGDRIAAGFSDRALHVLAISTGETVMTLRSLAALYSRDGSDVGLGGSHSGSGWVGLYELETGKRLWREAVSSFTILHAALGPDALVISEVGGPVRCLGYDGSERWQWSPPAGEHIERLAWADALARFSGVLRPYETKRSPAALVTFDGAGAVDSAAELTDAMEFEFMPAGDALVVATLDEEERSSAGEIVATPDARLVWRFRADVPLVVRAP